MSRTRFIAAAGRRNAAGSRMLFSSSQVESRSLCRSGRNPPQRKGHRPSREALSAHVSDSSAHSLPAGLNVSRLVSILSRRVLINSHPNSRVTQVYGSDAASGAWVQLLSTGAAESDADDRLLMPGLRTRTSAYPLPAHVIALILFRPAAVQTTR